MNSTGTGRGKESKIWIHKSADGDIAEKMQIAVIADDADIAEGVTMIKVKVDGTPQLTSVTR